MPNYVLDIELNADDNASGALDNVSGSVSGLGKASTGVAIGGVAALGAALVATGAHAIDLAGQVETTTATMQTQLGLSAQKAEEFEGVMRSIYLNNFGESFDDIGNALATVEQQFGRIGGTQTQEQMQTVTEQAFAIRDAFGVDVEESVSAAVTLMDEFGITSDQAFGIITTGMQDGLNASGDFLDSIGEYSNQFAGGGATAAEFFSIMESGLQGGVLGTDKAADAFKEFSIRILDDSEATKEALGAIGIDYEELRQGFQDGSITTIDAMQDVINKLNEIEDPVQRNVLGVALFGTQWEDMGEKSVLALDATGASMEDLEGGIESLDDQYSTSSAEWEAVTREWNDALVDVGAALRDLGVKVIPSLSGAMREHIVPTINEFVRLLDLIDQLGFVGGVRQSWNEARGGETLDISSTSDNLSVASTQSGGTGASGVSGYPEVNVNVNMQSGNASDAREGARAGVTEALQARGAY